MTESVVVVFDTVRVPVRYGETMVAVHLYIPASSRLSGENVRFADRDALPPPTLSHLNNVVLTARSSAPATVQDREYACPSVGCGEAIIRTDNIGAII